MPDLELIVDGYRYGGWQSVSVGRSMEQLAHTFKLDFHERWLAKASPLPIHEGARCTVEYGGERVITGYVDDSDLGYEERSSGSVTGRSKTGDIVDCSAKVQAWKKQGLKAIADAVCQPFGINVSVANGVDLGATFRRFAVQDGEAAHETLERAARMRGVLLTSDKNGDLVITRASAAKRTSTRIERGVNVIRGRRKGSFKDRFSDYTLKAQVFGDDDFNGQLAISVKATASDTGVTRYRPLTIMADAQETQTELQKRADWERNVRMGRSLRLSYTVHGWEHASGLWEPNMLVHVVDRKLAVDGEFLLVGAELVRDSKRTVAMELTDPMAMSIEPPKRDKKGEGFKL